ncbi:MAG TPA: C39 family peptidase [Candidatus Paceibacterota bacterium]|nr:C39 family peptidase [Candidatus Paceibacterota bacterium]
MSKAAPSAAATTAVPSVPFFSQFADIASPTWQKVGCGITDLTMIIDYYHPDAVSVETMLKKGIAAGAYDYNAGWIYQGLIDLSKLYGLDGAYYDLTALNAEAAYAALAQHVEAGPVIASVHYKFDPKNTIPHLVVINGIKDDIVYYNDPAAREGAKSISKSNFLKAWKKRIIDFRPSTQSRGVALDSH